MSNFHNTHIAIVSSILHPRYGGPAVVVDALERHLSAEFEVSVWGRIGQNEDQLYLRYPEGNFFKALPPHRWFYCSGLYKALINANPMPDLIHAHMLWDYSTFAAWRVAKKRAIPFVITPHGTLNESWRQSGLHKILYNRIILRRMFSDISCVHALNEREKQSLLSYGVNCPVEVIPNGIDNKILSIPRNPNAAEVIYPDLKGKKRILFMGRLWPEKGVDLLINAWAGLSEFHKDWVLIMAGPGYRGYESTLKNAISKASLEKTILLPGMVEGAKKEALFTGSDVFVLPSYSEGFSMAILEALGFGIPVIYTRQCNFPWVSKASAGIEIDCDYEELKKALEKILKLTDSERSSMGQKGKNLVSRHYTWDVVASSFKNLYRSLIKN
jgi:glycosyltransferase involved in cell wall biosynthesis